MMQDIRNKAVNISTQLTNVIFIDHYELQQ